MNVRILSAMLIAAALLVSGCGGGDDGNGGGNGDGIDNGGVPGGNGDGDGDGVTPPVACTKSVVSGFSGNEDWQAADGDGIGGGADGDGGVGIGGSLGTILRAEVRVYQQDGTEIGRAQTDSTRGMVTVRLCDDPGPLLVEIYGGASAVYYDEWGNAYRPYPNVEPMRALVQRVDKNIGVTPLTEAAVRFLVTSEGVQPKSLDAAVSGRAGAATVAEKALPAASQIVTANAAVRDATNALFGAGLAIDDITRLPRLIGQGPIANLLSTDQRSLYAVMLASLVRGAGTFNPTLLDPALELTEQYARDLTDGNVDGRDAAGAPVAAASQRAYADSTSEIAADLEPATISVVEDYGDPALVDLVKSTPPQPGPPPAPEPIANAVGILYYAPQDPAATLCEIADEMWFGLEIKGPRDVLLFPFFRSVLDVGPSCTHSELRDWIQLELDAFLAERLPGAALRVTRVGNAIYVFDPAQTFVTSLSFLYRAKPSQFDSHTYYCDSGCTQWNYVGVDMPQ